MPAVNFKEYLKFLADKIAHSESGLAQLLFVPIYQKIFAESNPQLNRIDYFIILRFLKRNQDRYVNEIDRFSYRVSKDLDHLARSEGLALKSCISVFFNKKVFSKFLKHNSEIHRDSIQGFIDQKCKVGVDEKVDPASIDRLSKEERKKNFFDELAFYLFSHDDDYESSSFFKFIFDGFLMNKLRDHSRSSISGDKFLFSASVSLLLSDKDLVSDFISENSFLDATLFKNYCQELFKSCGYLRDEGDIVRAGYLEDFERKINDKIAEEKKSFTCYDKKDDDLVSHIMGGDFDAVKSFLTEKNRNPEVMMLIEAVKAFYIDNFKSFSDLVVSSCNHAIDLMIAAVGKNNSNNQLQQIPEELLHILIKSSFGDQIDSLQGKYDDLLSPRYFKGYIDPSINFSDVVGGCRPEVLLNKALRRSVVGCNESIDRIQRSKNPDTVIGSASIDSDGLSEDRAIANKL